MKAIIAGGGTVGSQLAQQLVREGLDVVIVEQNAERARILANRLDCLVVTGGCNNLEVLRKASIEDADFFVAVTTSDEINMIACGLVSSEFHVGTKIARVRTFDYSSTAISGKSFLGIDRVVKPELEAAREIVRSVDEGAISDVFEFRNSPVQMRPISVLPDSRLAGRSVEEASQWLDASFIIGVIVRNRSYLIPDGTTMIREGDQLFAVATDRDFRTIFDKLGKNRKPIENIVIVGGGKVGRLVLQHLMRRDQPGLHNDRGGRLGDFFRTRHRRLQVVEQDYEKCKELSAMFPDILVTNADISDESAFQEEHFADADLIISTTENQELNMVTALYARTLGVKRSVVLVTNSSYVSICGQLNIDVAVSLKNAVVDTIVSTIRQGTGEVINSVRSISDGTVEVLELSVGSGSRVVGRPLYDIRLPHDSLIVSVSRDERAFVPNGDTVLAAGDIVVAIARHDQFAKLEKAFKKKS
ncbi:MAG: Trk system potassium transport protein TrkA [Spirochaetia bacterium]